MGSEMPAQLEIVDQFLEVDAAAGVLVGVHPHVAVLADGKVALAPAGDVVELGCLGGGPPVGGLANRAVGKPGGGHETSVSTDLVSGASEKWQPLRIGRV